MRAETNDSDVRRIDGYKGIWFDLGQRSEHGSKYSGGLGTYTAKHCPIAVYSAEAQKTFFFYGGTTESNKTHLLAMASFYDHKTGKVPKPVVVHDKQGVDDPHDNPSIQIDGDGHLWLFVSGRGKKRPGYVYRSKSPFDIESFEQVSEHEFTYPQPWWSDEYGFLFLFTKYTKGRELYWSSGKSSKEVCSAGQKLAGMGGHYQVSNILDDRVITAFNYHPKGNVDQRTNLYFIQSMDGGKSWRNVSGDILETPIRDINSKCLVHDYSSEKRLVYMKDIQFDAECRPVILYVTSSHHQPGPQGDPREWTVAHWRGGEWAFHVITTSSHNYDMGSLYIEDNSRWRVIAPTTDGPQRFGAGGEITVWISSDQGETWEMSRQITNDSTNNHGYVRRPLNAHPDFYGIWSDGNTNGISKSHLYFTNRDNSQIMQLPYDMKGYTAEPEIYPK